MDPVLQQIKEFADRAHGEQLRKYTPERYIVHPVRVMETCKGCTNDIILPAAALLHDVLEDTPVSKEEMSEFLQKLVGQEKAGQIVSLVQELTDEFVKSKYPQWNRRKRKDKEAARLKKVSAEAQTIKYADLMDNSVEIVNQDPEFAERYLKEAKNLLGKMKKGDKDLRQQAVETVNRGLLRLKEMQKLHARQTTSPSRS